MMDASKIKENAAIWAGSNPLKTITLIFILFVFLKISVFMLLSGSSPYTPDAFVYTKMADSFFEGNGFQVWGKPYSKYPPLYPIIISPAFIFNDMVTVFDVIGIINAIVSSLVIFPGYLLAREFLNVKKSIFVSVLVSVMAVSTCYGFVALSENLFVPLFVFSIFFLYKSVFEKGYKFKFLSGFFIGLCFLTKAIACALFPAMLIIFIFAYYYKNNNHNFSNRVWILGGIKNWLMVCMVSGLTALPWFIRNGSLFGYNIPSMLGFYAEARVLARLPTTDIAGSCTDVFNVLCFLTQIIIHNGLLILAGGIIFFVLGVILLYKAFKEKDTKLFMLGLIVFVAAESLVLLTAFHNTLGHRDWRLLGRYVTPALPIIVIYGYIAFEKLKLSRNVIYILIISFFPLLFLHEVVINDSRTITFIDIIQNPEVYLFFLTTLKNFMAAHSEFLFIFSLAVPYIIFSVLIFINTGKNRKLLFINGDNSKQFILILTILLIVSSGAISFTKEVAEKKIELRGNAYDIGKWLNSETAYNNKTVMFDEELSKERKKYLRVSFIGIWVNSPIKVGNISAINTTEDIDYIVSSQELDLPVAYQSDVLYSTNIKTALLNDSNEEITVYVYCQDTQKPMTFNAVKPSE